MGSSRRVAYGQEQGQPLLTIASKRVGLRGAFQVLAFMAAWDVARTRTRRETLTLQEYADYWRTSRATSFREQARFREAFPDEQTPDALLDRAAQQWDVRTGVKGLGAVTLA